MPNDNIHSRIESTLADARARQNAPPPPDGSAGHDVEGLLDGYQRAAFDYFLQQRNPANGLFADTSRENSPISIAVVGFALSSYPVAIERGWIPRGEALEHCMAALRFFRDSDQGAGAEATGYKGFYYHFLDRDSGKRVWRCELSMIDTALLIAGALTTHAYFDADTPDERDLRDLVETLYHRIDWRWAQDDGQSIRQGWKPECGFLHYGWEGYNEAIVLYALALGSPTHPIAGDCYAAWTATYQWENLYGHDLLYGGPLFTHQFSHAWIDFRGIRDRFMRGKDSDYFENSRRAVHVQREYTRINPRDHAGYEDDCWGLSACDGPSDEIQSVDAEPRRLFGYAARGVPYGPDDGTLSVPAVLACLPFEPELTLQAVDHMRRCYPETMRGSCFASSFNADLSNAEGRAWVSPGLFGLDQGIVLMMIENHRSGMIWRLLRGCEWMVDGLRRAGFDGGWLDAAADNGESELEQGT